MIYRANRKKQRVKRLCQQPLPDADVNMDMPSLPGVKTALCVFLEGFSFGGVLADPGANSTVIPSFMVRQLLACGASATRK